MSSGKNRVLALDIGASKLVLAEFAANRSGTPELVNYGVQPLGVESEQDSDSSAYIVAALRDVMKSRGIRPAPLLMAVSGQAVFPRYVKLPPVSKDKVLQMVQYEAEQNVPFPIEEVVWDYQLLGTEEDGSINVMLAAVKIENVKKLTDCVQGAGLEPEVVDVATMSLYNVVRYNYPDIQGCTMVLDIGARSSNLIFVEGNLIFSRSIPVAGNAITQELMKEFELSFKDAEEMKMAHAFVAFGGVSAGPEGEVADRVSKIVRNVITRLHAEVNRSINFYRGQQGGSPPSLVLLTGGSSVIPHMDTFFREKLKVDVEYLNPFVNITAGGAITSDKIAADLHLLGVVGGLALRRALKCPVEINLMPPDIVDTKRFEQRQPFFALAAVGLVAIIVCWILFAYRIRNLKEAQLDVVTKRCGELGRLSGNLKSAGTTRARAERKTAMVNRVVDQRTAWIEIFDSIHSCLLDGMWVTSVLPKYAGADGNEIVGLDLRVKGFDDKLKVATGTSTAFESFRDNLRKSPFFKDGEEGTRITKHVALASESVKECTLEVGLRQPIKAEKILIR